MKKEKGSQKDGDLLLFTSHQVIFIYFHISKIIASGQRNTLAYVIHIHVKHSFVYFPADFCGRPQWWFRNPDPVPTPFANHDKKCCEKTKEKLNVDFYQYIVRHTGHPGKKRCSVDLTKDFTEDKANHE